MMVVMWCVSCSGGGGGNQCVRRRGYCARHTNAFYRSARQQQRRHVDGCDGATMMMKGPGGEDARCCARAARQPGRDHERGHASNAHPPSPPTRAKDLPGRVHFSPSCTDPASLHHDPLRRGGRKGSIRSRAATPDRRKGVTAGRQAGRLPHTVVE